MSEPSESAAESIHLAWQHLDAAAPPELRRWLQTGKPVALHEDLLMIAVPNNFTRNQLEIRFRSDIEAALSAYFKRSVQLAVKVDESLSSDLGQPDQEQQYGDGFGGFAPGGHPGAGLDPQRPYEGSGLGAPGSGAPGWTAGPGSRTDRDSTGRRASRAAGATTNRGTAT